MVGESDPVGDAGDRARGQERDIGRRQFLSMAAVTGSMVAAGCSNDSGDDRSATSGRVRGGESDPISLMTGALPTTLDMGPNLGAVAGRPHFEGFLHSLVLPIHAPTGKRATSGHAWTLGDSELSVPCVVAAYEIASDGTVDLTFDDRLTYWNGESLDGRAYHLHDRLLWLEGGGAFSEESFASELVSDTEYRRMPTSHTTNPSAARSEVHPGMPPLPPSYVRKWLDRFEDASTEEAV